jgi:hypothetical protein
VVDYLIVDGSAGQTRFNAPALFFDNKKAMFGDGADLQIYHDGSNSYIKDAGTGNLRIDATNFYVRNSAGTELKIGAIDDGAVDLYHNGSKKLATTSSGIDVTGTVVSDGLNLGTTGNATLANILSADNTSNTLISGGNATNVGANYALFGGSHASLANVHRWRNGGTEIARFDASGNLGIGTTSPSSKLHLVGAGTTQTRYDNSSAGSTSFIGNDATGLFVGTTSNHLFRVSTNNTERMRIDTSGNVGIGTSSPLAKLESYVSGNFSTTYNDFSGDGLYIQTNGTTGVGEYTAGLSFSRTVANGARAADIITAASWQ